MLRQLRFVVFRLACGLAVLLGTAPLHAEPQGVPLRIAVYDVPPYGYSDRDGSIVGASVDLWRRVAEKIGQRYELSLVKDMDSLLRGLEQQKFDAAIGAITITPEREERVDFTYPAHRSGVAVALRKETGFLAAALSYLSAVTDLSGLIVLILALLITTGIAMWVIERPSHRAGHGESAVGTLRDGLYWAVVTMTTVGYGDKTPKTHSGRFIATLWMFGSLVLVSLLSTSLVAHLTADRVARDDAVATVDLAGKRLGAVTLSSGAEYLDALHLTYTHYADIPQALAALDAGQLDAVVNSVGALRWFVAKRFSRTLDVSPGLLAPAYMAIALPKGSALRHELDRALVGVTSSPDWTAAEARYFGP
ncbi:hypothetical protein RHAL1_02784 [Beijerinckiaceae bacterium RH AL1]|nr:hypothetical protein RHCH11_RHCH11_02727 [Beijerinckiaceae bacterium RH CH11]VVB47470.1 hypothetical protein RHAL8_02723 [Beijerinckiaceae bacterium RH AL8]VVC55861.1 hypothetical protein RHAL1_02784 [Beijerinckiaceae bacterium RH AL1]